MKSLRQPLYDVKYRISLGDLVELHYAILAYKDLDHAQNPDMPEMPRARGRRPR